MRSGVFVVVLLAILALASAEFIPNQYLVKIKPSLGMNELKRHILTVSSSPFFNAERDSITSQWVFEGLNFTGYAAHLSTPELVNFVKSRPEVVAFESDQVTSIDCFASGVVDGLWGLSRVSFRERRAAGSYQYLQSNDGYGENVDVYVMDTGILTTHEDFGGRASYIFNAFPNESPQDLNGHGTHCAGTIAGNAMGIAKRANLYSVKVLNAGGSGTIQGIIDGADYIIKNLHPENPCVINLSLGAGFSSILNDAVNKLVAAGCFTSVAAGNSNANACNYSPASAVDVYTVMATTNTDVRSSFSNYGTCCKVFAPGSNILSDWIGSSNRATNTISGTSMAAPHVAGVASSVLGLNPGFTPKHVEEYLGSIAQPNVIQSPGAGSPNLLLFQGCLTP